ncbi:Pr6Pr family membrane protein [Chitinophaga alhagiae]|uniref:Pr6Pr family membrane protein n=1 Tax=Chitinophaga alhagiae TaxID=2203219 RepID=UPI0018E56BF5|nr:Pr6Pr family membrane protein [Chitinophaga alhagiae]
MQQTKRYTLALLALLGWFAVIAQFCLMMVNSQLPAGETIIRFFSFFTVQSNILTAAGCTALLLKPGGFFSRASVQAALLLYILIVALVYNVILRFLWAPQGMQWLVDELLHAAVPLLYLAYWLIFAPKRELAWKQAPSWLLYPLAYMVFVIIRGAFSGFYPYPFIDVVQLDYPKALQNAALILVLFLFTGALIMAVGKALGKRPLLKSSPVKL